MRNVADSGLQDSGYQNTWHIITDKIIGCGYYW